MPSNTSWATLRRLALNGYSGWTFTINPLERENNQMPQTLDAAIDPSIENDVDVTADNRMVGASCACDPCKVNSGIPRSAVKLRHSAIHQYSYRPRRWTLKSAGKGDPFHYHLGVELETDRGRQPITMNSGYFNAVVADMRRPKRFWVAKHDGSVNGPEFASLPATLLWWREHEADLRIMFKMLVHAGFRSHEGGKAGMHVNVSTGAFDDSEHLYRFAALVYDNPVWSLLMSQRTIQQAESWARLSSFTGNPDGLHEWATRAMHNDWQREGRYIAVNCPGDGHRFEFRLPRGTLRVDRFFKNLEWTTAMVEFARNIASSENTVSNFIDWVHSAGDMYANLSGFLNEKRDAVKASLV